MKEFKYYSLTSNILHPITKHGFTMIELLIVIATMTILFTVGFANYRGFQQRQQLNSAVIQIKSDLRFAQEQALAGRKPTGCNLLNGYKFVYHDVTKYQVYANCDSDNDIALPSNPEVNFRSKYPLIEFNGGFDVYFNVLGRGVKSTSFPIVIHLINTSDSTQTATISITKGGEIN